MWFVIFDILLIFVPVIIYICEEQSKDTNTQKLVRAFKRLGLKGMQAKELVIKSTILLLMVLLISAILFLIFSFFGIDDTSKVNERVRTLGVALTVYVLVVRVPAEEIFFRGFLVKKIGIVPASLIFGLAHYGYGSIAEIIGAFVLGLVFSYAYKRNNNLLPNIIAHSLYNLLFFITLFGFG
ncbi:MAG: CPBP family intramembrane metalloprotease [Candidatus Diapherotrites archaeon]|uniref:CAAX prenyl protease 2/Lysostaphin resistance protein A-like domain-containing protein n=1 Tax=Candidatus Iainarchaeum sp. TaxID=3101447 RepID=A0A497JH35_9ARCH|nr:CPBP family intramembrane metalloprotease [Candidatus Diapherotrites archaeon]RLG70438.1 MAG: hypothetical protein DRO07_00210 [Candidatus Diapherotrites archaeon]